MTIGLLTVRLAIYEATSLKDKRRVVKSIKDKIRHKFNVAVAETDALDSKQRAVLSMVTVANETPFVEGCLQQIVNLVQMDRSAVLVDYQVEML